jgi:hypothetical protein
VECFPSTYKAVASRIASDAVGVGVGAGGVDTLEQAGEYLQLKKKKKKKRKKAGGCRDGSTVKSTGCSSRGPEFKSQQAHGGSQPSVSGSDALFWCV